MEKGIGAQFDSDMFLILKLHLNTVLHYEMNVRVYELKLYLSMNEPSSVSVCVDLSFPKQ